MPVLNWLKSGRLKRKKTNMKKIILMTLFVSSGIFSAEAKVKPCTAPEKTVYLDAAINDLNASHKKSMETVVSGEISAVCQAKGCWISLKPVGQKKKTDVCEETLRGASSQAEVRVMLNGHDFAVPKNLKGKVIVKGSIEKKKLSSFQLKHLLKDAQCSKTQIKKAKKSLHKYQMVADLVYAEGSCYSAL